MTFADTLRLALRNLGQAKLRTALTTMGVSIGIASLAGMVSLGLGLQEQFVGRFMQSGVFDAITVMPGSDRPGGFAALTNRGGRAGRRAGGGGPGRPGQTPAPSVVLPMPSASPAAPSKTHPPLDDAAIASIAALPNVKFVYPNVRVSVQIKHDQFDEWTQATGVPLTSRDEGAFQTIPHGAFFKNDADDTCMLTLDYAKRINEQDPASLVGKTLTIGYYARREQPAAGAGPTSAGPARQAGRGAAPPSPQDLSNALGGLNLGGLGAIATALQVQRKDMPFTVVGIVERDPSAGPLAGLGLSGVMLPLAKVKAMDAEVVTSAQSLTRKPGSTKTYNTLTVKVTRAAATEDVEDRVKGMGFNAFSINDALKGAKRAFLILDIVLSLVGSIALAVSSLGIVNTMVMSILERTREIGVMKAIGGSDGDIRRIFLIEASTIGLLGGLAGVVLGWVVGRAINFGANVYIQSQGGTPGNLFSLPLWLIGSAIGFSIFVSLIAGSYPASRAAKLDPIQALRHD